MPPEENFSYDSDVAPRTSGFFRSLQSSAAIDPADKRKIASDFFKDVSQIRQVRQRNEMFPLQLASQAVGLEASRFNLERARRQADEETRIGYLGSEIDDTTLGILDDLESTPEEKAYALQRAQFDALRKLPPSAAGAASWISRKFGAAMNVVKPQAQSEFTPSQIARFVAAGGDPAVVETGDPVLIGKAMSELAARKQQAVESEAATKAADVEKRRTERSFLEALNSVTDIDFAVDENSGKVDETKFKRGEIVIPKIKRALALAPDPKIRALGAAAGTDARKLKEAYLKANDLAAGAVVEKPALPARP